MELLKNKTAFSGKRKRVLCSFDYACTTGFATVSKHLVENLVNYFCEDIYLDILAINYFGEPFEIKDEFKRVIGNVVSARLWDGAKGMNRAPGQDQDVMGLDNFLSALKNNPVPYDGIFIINDVGAIAPIIPLLQLMKDDYMKRGAKPFKSIFYFPVDAKYPSKIYNPYYEQNKHRKDVPEHLCVEWYSLFDNMHFFDLLVTYTEFGRNEVLRHRRDLAAKLKVVPHGSDLSTFFQMMPRPLEFRNTYFTGHDMSDRFIITNINRNQFRKDIPATIFSFVAAKKLFKEIQADKRPFLYLHMRAKDEMGWNIRRITESLDLIEGEDFAILDDKISKDGMTAQALNLIYNASDAFLTTVQGGGWELTVTEAFSTGLPVICPAHTSLMELGGDGSRAVMLRELSPAVSMWDNIVREQVNYEEVAEALAYVAGYPTGAYENETMYELRLRVSAAKKWVETTLPWEKVCERWIEYFELIYK